MSKTAVPALRSVLLSVLFIFALFVGASFATDIFSCQTISSSGSYTLTQNVVSSGTCFALGANSVILDCAGHSITGGGSGSGIYDSGYNNVTMKNCIITGFGDNGGIYLGSSSNNTVSNNTASSNSVGIRIDASSNNNLIINNNASSNVGYDGILIEGSNNNFVANNTASSNNRAGIYLESSSDNTVTNNTASSNNQYNIILDSSSNGNFVANNTISNTGYGIFLQSSSNNIIANNILSSNGNGVVIFSGADNNTIANNTNSNTYRDVYFDVGQSFGNLFYNNLFNSSYNDECTANGIGICNSAVGSSSYWNTTLNCNSIRNIVNGPCIGGNFWAAPDGSGWSQTVSECNANSDRICTSLYTTDTSDIDYLPLAMPPPATFTAASASNANGSSYAFGTWTNQSVTVALTCYPTTNTTCKMTSYCTTTGASCTPNITYTKLYTISSNRVTTNCFQSTDNAGYVENANCVQVMVDKVPPVVTSSTISGTIYTLNCANNLSGCSLTNYCTGSGSCTPNIVYNGPYLVQTGTTTCFQSVDIAGNAGNVSCAIVSNTTCSGGSNICQVATIQEADSLEVTYKGVSGGYACLQTVQVPPTKRGGSPTTAVQQASDCILPLQLGSVGDSLGEQIILDHEMVFRVSDLGINSTSPGKNKFGWPTLSQPGLNSFGLTDNNCSDIYDGVGQYTSLVSVAEFDATANDSFGVPNIDSYLVVKRVQIYDPVDGSIRNATLCGIVNRNDFQILGKSGPVVPTAVENLGLSKTVTKLGITLNPLGNTVGGFRVGAPTKLSPPVQPSAAAQTVTAVSAPTTAATQPSVLLSMLDDHTDSVFEIGLLVAVAFGFLLSESRYWGEKKWKIKKSKVKK